MSFDGLVEPAYWSGPDYFATLGSEVADLNEMVGFGPDPEQRLALDMLFAVDRHGKAAAVETCVICARQNLKTGFMKQAALGWLFLTEERLIVWSAHEFSTAVEAHRDLSQTIEGSSWLSRRVKQIYNSAADKSIELTTGARLIFKARTLTGTRGLSAPKLFLDEGFALKREHMGAIIPAQSAMANPQRVIGSSAGMAESEILRAMRDRGRSGQSVRQAYLEWCAARVPCERDGCDHELATPGCALDRPELWAAANPSLDRPRANGTGITTQTVLDERESLPPEEFARERMGWWDEPGASEIFGPGKWEICGAEPRPTPSRLGAIGLAVDVELSRAAVVAAGLAGAAGSRVAVRPLQHGAGVSWLVDRLKVLQREHGAVVVLDGRGPAAQLVPQLKAAGIRYHAATTAEVLDAFDVFYLTVTDGTLTHADYPELNSAVDGATTRTAGSGGDRRTWGRRSSKSDITPLEAGTLATWWVCKPQSVAPPPLPPQATPDAGEQHEFATAGF